MIEYTEPMFALACALIVSVRVAGLLNKLSFKERARNYARWLAFGASYAALMVAAIGSMVHIWQGQATFGEWLWLASAAGVFLFDRRQCREKEAAKA